MFFRSQTAPEQAHMASALVFELSKVETPHVREAIVGHLRNIDADLAKRVADGLGMDSAAAGAEPAAAPVHGHAAVAGAADHRQDEGHARGPRASAS